MSTDTPPDRLSTNPNSPYFDQALLQRLAQVDPPERLEERLGVELLVDDRVEQLVLGREHPEDGALGDAGRLGDEPGRGRPAVLEDQRPRGREDGRPPLLGGKRTSALTDDHAGQRK